jgi:hypothetical protein
LEVRAPICFNPPAARSHLPLTLKKTEVILASRSKDQMSEAVKAAFDRKELPTLESGAMCSMMSKQGYLSGRDGHWHPHLMFFLPLTTLQLGAQACRAPRLWELRTLRVS